MSVVLGWVGRACCTNYVHTFEPFCDNKPLLFPLQRDQRQSCCLLHCLARCGPGSAVPWHHGGKNWWHTLLGSSIRSSCRRTTSESMTWKIMQEKATAAREMSDAFARDVHPLEFSVLSLKIWSCPVSISKHHSTDPDTRRQSHFTVRNVKKDYIVQTVFMDFKRIYCPMYR